MRSAIRDVDAADPIAEIVPLRDTLARALMRDRFLTVLIGAFAGLALLLAVLGIYGVLDPMTYVVVGCLLTAAALLATIVPAARATRVDPARAFH